MGHQQALLQAVQRFTESANQFMAWTSILVPKLRILQCKSEDLRLFATSQSKLLALEREKIEAEDECDSASAELRKHKRHAQASRLRSVRSPTNIEAQTMLAKQFELREHHAEERVRKLTEELNETESQLEQLASRLPFIIDVDDGDPDVIFHTVDASQREKLEPKLAELQKFHDEMVQQTSDAAHQNILTQVQERRSDEALRIRIEPDFICPIMHERMVEPVLAADGHTYERQAIEKWLQTHNTSPMTGAPLPHRYLTENFALRHLITAYEEGVKKEAPMSEDKANIVNTA